MRETDSIGLNLRTSRSAVALLLIAICLLSGCRRWGEPIETDFFFNKKSTQSVLVFGNSLKDRAISQTEFLTIITVWREYNEKTLKLLPFGKEIVVSRTRWGASKRGILEPLEYLITDAAPGKYALSHFLIDVNIEGKRHILTTSLVGLEPDSLRATISIRSDSSVPSDASVASPRVPKVTLKAGEIIYVGNMQLNLFIEHGRPKLSMSKYWSTATNARQKLLQYPNLKGELIHRQGIAEGTLK